MIRLENIVKTYPLANDELVVLKDINLEIKRGEIYGIVGKTASGKSTLLRLMNGFIEADEGNIYIDAELLDKKSRSRLVQETSMIFQSYNLLSNLSVIENVMLPNKLRKEDKQCSRERAYELLEFVGLREFADSSINTLSGGGKQRVAIARSLMTRPQIILCDEPTSALDDATTYGILKLLKEANDRFNTTIVVVSHDTNVIQALCDRVAILEEGNISDILTLEKTELKPHDYKEALVYRD